MSAALLAIRVPGRSVAAESQLPDAMYALALVASALVVVLAVLLVRETVLLRRERGHLRTSRRNERLTAVELDAALARVERLEGGAVVLEAQFAAAEAAAGHWRARAHRAEGRQP